MVPKKPLPQKAWPLLLLVLLISGCAHTPPPLKILDSPKHHVTNGLKLLQRGLLDAADREFQMALTLEPDYGPAYRGAALARAMEWEFQLAFREIRRAVRNSGPEDLEDPLHESFNCCCMRRWVTLGRKQIKDMPFSARLFLVQFLNEYYTVGVSYKSGKDYKGELVSLDGSLLACDTFAEEATRHVSFARQLESLTPTTVYARGLAYSDGLTRAEAAALLVRELEIKKLIPESAAAGGSALDSGALRQELNDNILKEDVLTVLHLGTAGFDLTDEGLFQPDRVLPRAEYAAALNDILQRTGTAPFGPEAVFQTSPFQDVPLSSSYFKGVMAAVRAGLLEAEGGYFRPQGPLTGLEALQSMNRLKERLRDRVTQ